MPSATLKEWIKNTTEAVRADYDAYDSLSELFDELGLFDEFDKAWQWGGV